jgi:DNA-binding XRE family transcriptional regulator
MDGQDWNPVVLKKHTSKPISSAPKQNSAHVLPNESLDISDTPIKYFTLAMGQKISSLRAEKKWTQEELAKKLCIPKQTITLLEQGKEKYNGPLVSKLKKVLGNFSW